jgi:hypothetical protein
MATIKLVRNDTAPQLRLTLTDSQTGAAINLTGATVTLHLRAVNTTTLLLTRNAVIQAPATAGIAVIVWQPSDLDLEPGDYEGEIEVTLADGTVETLFNPLQFTVREEFD